VFLPELRLIKSVQFLGPEVAGARECKHKRIESMILLLPEPLGPDMTLKPSKKGILCLF